jgi:hypothetical protein
MALLTFTPDTRYRPPHRFTLRYLLADLASSQRRVALLAKPVITRISTAAYSHLRLAEFAQHPWLPSAHMVTDTVQPDIRGP